MKSSKGLQVAALIIALIALYFTAPKAEVAYWKAESKQAHAELIEVKLENADLMKSKMRMAQDLKEVFSSSLYWEKLCIDIKTENVELRKTLKKVHPDVDLSKIEDVELKCPEE